MLTLIYDYLDENIENAFRFESIDNHTSIEKQVENGALLLVVEYTCYDDDHNMLRKTIKISSLKLMAWVYKKVVKITPDEHDYDERG